MSIAIIVAVLATGLLLFLILRGSKNRLFVIFTLIVAVISWLVVGAIWLTDKWKTNFSLSLPDPKLVLSALIFTLGIILLARLGGKTCMKTVTLVVATIWLAIGIGWWASEWRGILAITMPSTFILIAGLLALPPFVLPTEPLPWKAPTWGAMIYTLAWLAFLQLGWLEMDAIAFWAYVQGLLLIFRLAVPVENSRWFIPFYLCVIYGLVTFWVWRVLRGFTLNDTLNLLVLAQGLPIIASYTLPLAGKIKIRPWLTLALLYTVGCVVAVYLDGITSSSTNILILILGLVAILRFLLPGQDEAGRSTEFWYRHFEAHPNSVLRVFFPLPWGQALTRKDVETAIKQLVAVLNHSLIAFMAVFYILLWVTAMVTGDLDVTWFTVLVYFIGVAAITSPWYVRPSTNWRGLKALITYNLGRNLPYYAVIGGAADPGRLVQRPGGIPLGKMLAGPGIALSNADQALLIADGAGANPERLSSPGLHSLESREKVREATDLRYQLRVKPLVSVKTKDGIDVDVAVFSPFRLSVERAAAITPNGRHAILANYDGTLHQWNLETPCIGFFGHAAPVRAAAITSDGRRVVSVSADGTFQAWDTATRAGICSERIPRGACAVAVTSDGLRTVIGFGDGTREVWNLPRRVNWYTLNGNGHSASAIAVTSDGRRIFSAFADGTLRVSDLKGPDYRERTLGGEQKEVCAVVMTSDGQHGISASCDGTLKVWNLEQLKEEKTLVGRQRGIRALAMVPNDCNALFISADGTLRVWDLRTGREGRTLNDDPAWVHAVAMTPNGGQIVLAHANGRLEVCNAWHKKQVLRGHRDWVRAVAMTPHASRVVSTSSDGLLKIWDLATGEELFSQEGHAKARALATTGDGDCIISGYSDGRLKIWKLQQGVNAIEIQDERTLIGHSHWVCAVAITPDGRRAVSAAPSDIPSSSSQDGLELKVWNPRTGEEERDLSRPFDDHWVYAMAITPSGRRAFMAVADGRVRVLNLVNSGRLPSIPDVPARDPPREVRAIAFSARAHPGNELILVCSDGTIEKLRLRRNRETREFQWQGDRHSTKDWQRAVRDPVPELGRPFPYDEEAVLKAVHAQQIDQAEDEKSGWDRLAHLRCSAALRDIVAGYNLDELCGPDEPPDADPRRDAIAAEMRNKVKGQIRKWGLQLIGGGIGNLDPPDKVINQRIVHWQAHLQTEIKMLEAQAEAESRRMIERSRAGAERELIERISEINEQLQRLDPQRRKGVLALRVIAAIEQSATTAGDSGSQDQTSSGDVTPLV